MSIGIDFYIHKHFKDFYAFVFGRRQIYYGVSDWDFANLGELNTSYFNLRDSDKKLNNIKTEAIQEEIRARFPEVFL
jgi:hypothetical protein